MYGIVHLTDDNFHLPRPLTLNRDAKVYRLAPLLLANHAQHIEEYKSVCAARDVDAGSERQESDFRLGLCVRHGFQARPVVLSSAGWKSQVRWTLSLRRARDVTFPTYACQCSLTYGACM